MALFSSMMLWHRSQFCAILALSACSLVCHRAMISFHQVTYAYPRTIPGRESLPALSNLSLEIEEGELLLVVGPSGAGKSTFLRCLNGLVPHFYGGKLSGRIEVAGRDPIALGPQAMSQVVGMVFQNPEAQFVTDRVEDELAFGLENMALPPALMRKRVEEVLDQLSIAHLRDRHLATLSGGEKQRVAIAAVLTMHPQVLVLDEPTSQLDPQSAEEVLVAVRRLNEDLGLTVILAEHRLERVVQFVDRVLYLPGNGDPPLLNSPQEVMARVSLTPPLATLGKHLGWRPLPLTVKQARRFVRGLRAGVTDQQGAPNPGPQAPMVGRSGLAEPQDGSATGRRGSGQVASAAGRSAIGQTEPVPGRPGSFLARALAAELATLSRRRQPIGHQSRPAAILEAQEVWYRYNGGQPAVRGVSLSLRPGEVVALMGRNGSGKSTLLKLLVGLLKPQRGQVLINPRPGQSGQPPPRPLNTRDASLKDVVRVVGYVPQDPGNLLFRDTVLEELAFTRQGHGMPADQQADLALLTRLGLAAEADRYPRDLSAGQRQRVALAAILVANPLVILLDEPTRGLDYEQKEALTAILNELKAAGRAVLLATHDVELTARCADRVILMGDGEIVVDGPTRQVMTGSLVFASQINKLFRDPRYLIVEDVMSATHVVAMGEGA